MSSSPEPSLLERETLLAELTLILAQSAAGSGSMVFVEGEAGSGKTSLVDALTAAQPGSTLVIRGACDPLTTPRPLSPVYDFVAQADSGLRDLNIGGMEPYAVFDELLDRLRHSIRPIVMVIEDVHWADQATLDLLRFVGRRVDTTPATVLVTYRDTDVSTRADLRDVLGELLALPSSRRLEVPPLSVDAVAQLAASSNLNVTNLHRRTGGNPFFVTEVIAAGAELPPTVRDAVVTRAARLPDDAHRVVRVTSLSPRELRIDHAIALSGHGAASVDTAVASGVLVSSGTAVRFRHEIARSAIEETVPPAESLMLHRAIIDLLEAAESPDISRLAHHAIRAGDHKLTVRYGPGAGDEAAIRGSRREAVAFYRATIDAGDALLPRERASVLYRLGRELTFVSDYGNAADALRESASLFLEHDEPEAAALAMILAQVPVWEIEGMDAAMAVTEDALATLEPLGDSDALALAQVRVAHNHMIARRRDEALRAVARARKIASVVDNQEARWRADEMEATVELVMGDARRGAERLWDAVSGASSMHRPDLENHALGMLGSGSGEARLYDVAIRALERSVQMATATDDDGNASYSMAWLSRVAFEQGHWEAVLSASDQTRERNLPRRDIATVTAASARARTLIRIGTPGGLDILKGIVERGDDLLLQYVWNAYCGVAEYYWLQNRGERAAESLGRAYARAVETDSPWAQGEVGFWMWRIGAIDAPPPDAAEPFALQMRGAWREAADAWDHIGCPYEAALALADGDEAAKREAIAIFDDLGAMPAAGLVRQLLRESGASGVPRGPIQSTRMNPAGLTTRQLEILRFVVAGLSNQEIADRAYISKKTVEHHVSAIYLKLGVDTRPKAIAHAIALGLVDTGV